MFVTSPEMRHQLGSAIFPGHDVWRVIQVPLANPLVISHVVTSRGKRNEHHRTYISEANIVAAMALEPNVHIFSLNLLLPPQIAATIEWEVHVVQELWLCEEPDNPGVYSRILSTAEYDHSDSVCGTAAEDLNKRQLLYRLKAAATSPRRQRK